MHANQLKSKSQKPNFYFYTTASLSKLGSVKKSNVIVAFSVYLTFSKSDLRFMIRTKWRCCRKKKFMIINQFVEFDISSLFL